MEVKYTIIIPHYNSPLRLQALLESIPKAPDIQVIVVDDNSTKDKDVLGKVIQEDGRCEFYTNDTGLQSAGACRNVGVEYARGKWILFSDADDYFTEGFYERIERLYDAAEDIVFFAPTSLDLASGEVSYRHILYAGLAANYVKQPNAKNELNLKYRFCVPWSKMYKRVFIEKNDIKFETTPVSNDIMFSTIAALCAKSIRACDETIYCVVKDSNTLTTSTTTANECNFDVRVDVRIRRRKLLGEHLSKKEMKQVGLFCGDLLFMAFKSFGVKKSIGTAKVFRKNKVKVFTLNWLNLVMARQMLR